MLYACIKFPPSARLFIGWPNMSICSVLLVTSRPMATQKSFFSSKKLMWWYNSLNCIYTLIVRLFPTTIQNPYAGIAQFYFEIARVHLKLYGFTWSSTRLTFKYSSDQLGLVKVSHDDISDPMDDSAILEKIARQQENCTRRPKSNPLPCKYNIVCIQIQSQYSTHLYKSQ